MNGLHRKGGTMLTADEVAAVAGGAPEGNATALVAPVGVAIEATDYPRNPAGPVATESEEMKFNRK